MKTMIDPTLFREMPLFRYLSEEEIASIMESAQLLNRPKNTFLYDLDTPSDHLFILVKGMIKVGTFSADGREVLKGIVHPVSILGELGLAGEVQRREFARTLNEAAQLIAIPVTSLRQLMARNADFSIRVLDHIGGKLLQTERRMESLIFQDARTRIIHFLKESAAKRGRRVGFEWLFKHSLTQQDIANITGTSRQTVTSVLNELRKENLIHFNRRSILIRDLTRLA